MCEATQSSKWLGAGGDNSEKTSIYKDGGWIPGPNMKIRRGYQASCTLSNGKVFFPTAWSSCLLLACAAHPLSHLPVSRSVHTCTGPFSCVHIVKQGQADRTETGRTVCISRALACSSVAVGVHPGRKLERR